MFTMSKILHKLLVRRDIRGNVRPLPRGNWEGLTTPYQSLLPEIFEGFHYSLSAAITDILFTSHTISVSPKREISYNAGFSTEFEWPELKAGESEEDRGSHFHEFELWGGINNEGGVTGVLDYDGFWGEFTATGQVVESGRSAFHIAGGGIGLGAVWTYRVISNGIVSFDAMTELNERLGAGCEVMFNAFGISDSMVSVGFRYHEPQWNFSAIFSSMGTFTSTWTRVFSPQVAMGSELTIQPNEEGGVSANVSGAIRWYLSNDAFLAVQVDYGHIAVNYNDEYGGNDYGFCFGTNVFEQTFELGISVAGMFG